MESALYIEAIALCLVLKLSVTLSDPTFVSTPCVLMPLGNQGGHSAGDAEGDRGCDGCNRVPLCL